MIKLLKKKTVSKQTVRDETLNNLIINLNVYNNYIHIYSNLISLIYININDANLTK